MSTYKVHKTKDYTVMSNTHLRDRNLSLKAKGLLSLMLSLPEDWDYSMNGLVAISKENLTAIRSTLTELEDNKYLIRERKHNNNGRFEYEYHIFETPHTEMPQEEKPYIEKPYTVNNTQLSTNELITKELSTNKLITKDKQVRKNSFDKIIFEYTQDEKIIDLLQEWLKVRKAKRAAMTDRSIQMNINKLDSLAKESNLSVEEYLKEVICRGWAAFYAIKQWNNNSNQGKVYGASGIEINQNANSEELIPGF